MMEIVGLWRNVFVSWCDRGWHRTRTLLRRDGENSEQRLNGGEENRKSSVNVNIDGAEEYLDGSPVMNGENRSAELYPGSNGDKIGKSVERTAESRDGVMSQMRSKVSRGNQMMGMRLRIRLFRLTWWWTTNLGKGGYGITVV